MLEEMQIAPALTRALQFTPGDGGPARDVLVTIGPLARALLGQTETVLFLQVAALFVLGYATYHVIVHVLLDKPRPKHRPHTATSATEEPPAPAPVASATAEPTATAAPTVTAAPTATTVPLAPKMDTESQCKPYFDRCLENTAQPKWNRKDFGPKKDCGACFRECKNHAKGTWPNYKCPDE